ncbi:MAG: signal peptide peptidase SppA [Tissierellia bacterium]|nr:signal peptide peptidase SppA [Tissierellia bacterium]
MFQKMNTKRWIALGVAILIIGLSSISTGISGLVNREAQTQRLEEELNKLTQFQGLTRATLEGSDSDNQIAVLRVDGAIMSGTSVPFGSASYDHSAFLAQLKDIGSDDSVKAILLQVNSPGGGVYESAEIHRALEELKEAGITIYSSFETMAASGGYYISAGSDKIYATPSTLTGSIGVIIASMNVSGLMEKLGIQDQVVKSGVNKDIFSSNRPITEEERAIMQGLVDDMYGEFLNVVSTGRNMPMETLRPLADGRIYSGNQALQNGLVDEIGYPDDALAALKETLDSEDPLVYEYSVNPMGNFFSYFYSKGGAGELEALKSILISGYDQGARPLYLYGGES